MGSFGHLFFARETAWGSDEPTEPRRSAGMATAEWEEP